MTFRMKIMDNTSTEKRLISAQDSASGRAAWRARVREWPQPHRAVARFLYLGGGAKPKCEGQYLQLSKFKILINFF